MKKLFKSFNSLLNFCFILIALAAIGVALLRVDSINKWALNKVTSMIEEHTSLKVSVQEANYIFPLGISLKGFALEGHNQPLIQIEDLTLTCSLQELLEGNLVFTSISGTETRLHTVSQIPPFAFLLTSAAPLKQWNQLSLTSTDPFEGHVSVASGPFHAQSHYSWIPSSGLAFKDLLLKIPHFDLAGEAELAWIYTQPIQHIRWTLSQKNDLPNFDGLKLVGPLSIDGLWSNNVLEASFEVLEATFKESVAKDWKGQLRAQFNDGDPQADFTLSFQHNDAPWKLMANLKSSKDTIALSKIQLSSPDHLLEGDFSYFPEHSNWIGRFNGLIDSIGLNADGMLSGHFAETDKDYQLQIHHASGTIGPYPFKLLSPLNFSHSADSNAIDLLHFAWGEAEAKLGWQQTLTSQLLTFATTPAPLELLHFIYPDLFFTGRAAVQGSFSEANQQTTGQVKLSLHHLQINEDIFMREPLIEGEVNLNFDANQMQLSSRLLGIGKGPVIAQGTIPARLQLTPLTFSIDQNQPFSMKLRAKGELDPYLHLFFNDTTNLSAQADIALEFGGTLQTPQLFGTLDLSQGSYESLSTGALYRNIQARLEGNGSEILLKNFSAQDDKQGSIAASGKVSLDQRNAFPFSIQIHPQNIYVMESDYIMLKASGPLELEGNTKQAKLKGSLTIDQGEIHIDQALPQQIKTVNFRIVNPRKVDDTQVVQEVKHTSLPLEMDIAINAPETIKIEGSQLSSEWKGQVQLTGTTTEPLLNGDLKIVKGKYKVSSKEFELTQGNIHFAGPPGKKTTLYVVASKEIDRIKAEIIANGPVAHPHISLRSTPPMSQREVLSYILFNRGIADITPDQGDKLSQSFLSISETNNTSNSQDFLSRFRSNIGIDRLDITSGTGENKDLALQVGKNITDDIFISMNKSISDIGNKVAIEAKLRKNLKAEAEVEIGGASQGKVSLKWKKDY